MRLTYIDMSGKESETCRILGAELVVCVCIWDKIVVKLENVEIWGINPWGILRYEKVVGLLSITYWRDNCACGAPGPGK